MWLIRMSPGNITVWGTHATWDAARTRAENKVLVIRGFGCYFLQQQVGMGRLAFG